MLGKNLMTLLREFEVCIPMLQRDYAQGRRSQEHVARKFLDAIFRALESGEALHIDFVYGYRQDGKFILIDGQQRLTTLWLLHLYLYRKAGKLDAESQKLFERFSYAVRPSSVEFCLGLVRKDFLGDGVHPSEIIVDKGGFVKNLEPEYDPTIKAMMYMLDLIDLEVRDRDAVAMVENLDKITFDFFDMDEFGLGEELYIKMNARGKQLSDYENLKAFIQKDLDINEESVILKRMDTEWSDYFYLKQAGERLNIEERGARFDDRGWNFLHYGALFFNFDKELPKSKEVSARINHEHIDAFYEILQNINNLISLDRTLELFRLFARDEELKNMLIVESLEFLSKPNFFDKTKKKSQNEDVGRLSLRYASYFFAILWYVQRYVGDIDDILNGGIASLRDYLKVSKHLIENHRLDQPYNLTSFFELFKFLSSYAKYGSVYEFMVSEPYEAKFHKEMYGLEVRKAALILQSRFNASGGDWEKIFDETSNHPVFMGWVDHLLNFSAPDFKDDEPYKNKEYGDFDLERFQQYARLSMQILDASFLEENLALLQRAWLGIGDYGIWLTNWFYGNCPSAVGFRDREAWNWLINGKDDVSLKPPYFKRLLDKLIQHGAHGLVSNEELRDVMQKVIDGVNAIGRDWWEQILIKQKGVFEFFEPYKNKEANKFCRIYCPEDVHKVVLLPRRNMNSKNAMDLLGYGFYNYCEVVMGSVDAPTPLGDGEDGSSELKFGLHKGNVYQDIVVRCNGAESSIAIGNNDPYPINLYEVEDIFEEFDAALESAGLA